MMPAARLQATRRGSPYEVRGRRMPRGESCPDAGSTSCTCLWRSAWHDICLRGDTWKGARLAGIPHDVCKDLTWFGARAAGRGLPCKEELPGHSRQRAPVRDMPKENSVPRGFGPMGRMLKWHRDDPNGFKKAYHRRSLVEGVFSVIKERFGAVARARTAPMRRVHLSLMCICYNLVA